MAFDIDTTLYAGDLEVARHMTGAGFTNMLVLSDSHAWMNTDERIYPQIPLAWPVNSGWDGLFLPIWPESASDNPIYTHTRYGDLADSELHLVNEGQIPFLHFNILRIFTQRFY